MEEQNDLAVADKLTQGAVIVCLAFRYPMFVGMGASKVRDLYSDM